MSDEIQDKAAREAVCFGGRIKAAAIAYPLVLIVVFFAGRWSTWVW